MYLKLFAVIMMTSCAAGALELEPHGCGNKKIILTGWEFSYLTPADYLANADELDKTPADGVVIYIQKNPLAATIPPLRSWMDMCGRTSIFLISWSRSRKWQNTVP